MTTGRVTYIPIFHRDGFSHFRIVASILSSKDLSMHPPSAPLIVLVVVTLSALTTTNGFCWAFSARATTVTRGRSRRRRGGSCMKVGSTSKTSVAATAGNDFLDEKVKLVTLCTQGSKPSLTQVQSCVKSLEQMAEDLGLGQASSSTGLLNGEW